MEASSFFTKQWTLTYAFAESPDKYNYFLLSSEHWPMLLHSLPISTMNGFQTTTTSPSTQKNEMASIPNLHREVLHEHGQNERHDMRIVWWLGSPLTTPRFCWLQGQVNCQQRIPNENIVQQSYMFSDMNPLPVDGLQGPRHFRFPLVRFPPFRGSSRAWTASTRCSSSPKPQVPPVWPVLWRPSMHGHCEFYLQTLKWRRC